jgi:hypothetical protein
METPDKRCYLLSFGNGYVISEIEMVEMANLVILNSLSVHVVPASELL